MSKKIPNEVSDAIKHKHINVRLTHKKQANGDNCSVGKTPSLIVTKRHTHWFWYCFRCKEFGQIPFETNTPKATLKLINANKAECYRHKAKTFTLPNDYVKITATSGPAKAKAWLWKYGIGINAWKKYEIGWSDAYKRVIFPIYESVKMSSKITRCHCLVAWVARDVGFIQPKDKGLINVPKYLLKVDSKKTRKYFLAKGQVKSNNLVIVEDILSAIKIAECMKNTDAVALLNSSIDTAYVLRRYRKHKVQVWLDANKRTDSVMATARLSQFGVAIKHVFTFKDPKELSPIEIVTKLT